MFHRILADAVVVVHLAFALFAVLGGLLAFRWRWVIWTHLPAALWAVWIEFTNRVCPLTPLENMFRVKGGEAGYTDSFIDHYLLPLVYPADFTRNKQIVLGTLVLVVNLWIYHRVFLRTGQKLVS